MLILEHPDKVTLAVNLAEDKKAFDVLLLDLRGLTLVADFFLICSGRTPLQVKAVAEGIREGMAGEGFRTRHVEGIRRGRWALLDYGDLVIHVFQQEDREYYSLDRLWGDAERVNQEPVEHP